MTTLNIKEEMKALEEAQERYVLFSGCKHSFQQFTEVCSKCGESAYVTEEEMKEEAIRKAEKNKEKNSNFDLNWG